ncbi:MAG: cyclic pyranopterin monophosphate synthase MoaC [Pseudomonadota bacterium]|jgi:cyclic pyranopterin phosphate synthase|nr:cyclic pyranopterin monophosphate synthase MoaC [Pseudomonadota bacterium]
MSNNHIGETGNLHMIDVSSKEVTTRTAKASGTITLNNEAFSSIVDLNNKKGDVLNAARLAGINAAKQTSNLIPLAHNISLNSVDIDFKFDRNINQILSIAQVKSEGKTGVEIEALVAVEISLMTIYDMCKYLDRGMEINKIRLLKKTGGKSGTFIREDNA